jgi:deazaflavin-dependent oxidoreductase (nitroreductase family)
MAHQNTLISKLPDGLLRGLLRLPIILYRLHLGWLMGERLVLLNHIGRKSGQVHQTVVEIIGHDSASDNYYIVSGWGYKSNWYQNLLAHPTINIQVGRRRLEVQVESLSPVEGAQILLNYRQHHRLAARELSRLMGLDLMQSSTNTLEQLVRDSLPVIALRPRAAAS